MQNRSSLRRSAAGLARDMRAELGRGRVGWVTRVRATGAHAGVKRKQRVCHGSNAYATEATRMPFKPKPASKLAKKPKKPKRKQRVD